MACQRRAFDDGDFVAAESVQLVHERINAKAPQ